MSTVESCAIRSFATPDEGAGWCPARASSCPGTPPCTDRLYDDCRLLVDCCIYTFLINSPGCDDMATRVCSRWQEDLRRRQACTTALQERTLIHHRFGDGRGVEWPGLEHLPRQTSVLERPLSAAHLWPDCRVCSYAVYLFASTSFWSCAASAPCISVTFWPFLKNWKVGMHWIPQAADVSCTASAQRKRKPPNL